MLILRAIEHDDLVPAQCDSGIECSRRLPAIAVGSEDRSLRRPVPHAKRQLCFLLSGKKQNRQNQKRQSPQDSTHPMPPRLGKLKRSKKRQGRPPAVRKPVLLQLFLVDCFLEFGPRSELRDFAGSNLDRRASLWIAPIPGLSLRHGERAEANQRHAISFAEGRRNAVNSGINGGRSLRLADFTRACDLINQIGFIHSFSSQVSFIPSPDRGSKVARAELGNLTARYSPPSAANVNCENPRRKPVSHLPGPNCP